ncbi:MAG: mechanosensitive ion channel family protein [Rubrivivax sp.]|nr:MAG: mechanosensitive ion channel family protein [Rubrivivax sp.]
MHLFALNQQPPTTPRRLLAFCWRPLAAALVLGSLLVSPTAALAQTDEAPEPATLLDVARKDLEAVRATDEEKLDDAGMLALRKRALSAQTKAEEAATAMAPELSAVQARLAELGTPAAGVKESPDVAAQRAQLLKSVSTLDSQIKLARLVAVEAEQAAATALANRRLLFSARLEERVPAVLGTDFWDELSDDLPADWRRLQRLGEELRESISVVSFRAWLAVGAAVTLLLLLWVVLQRSLVHLSTTRVPSGRLRRSLYALGVLAVGTVIPGLIVHAVLLALHSGGGLPVPLAKLAESTEAIVWFGGFVSALGAALLMPGKPSWRLPPVTTETAVRLRWFPLALALAIVLSWVSSRLALLVDASVTTAWAVKGLGSLTFVLVLGGALVQLKRSHRERALQAASVHGHDQNATAPGVALPLWLPTLRTAMWITLVVATLALLSGYMALGNFIISQLVWGLIVLSSAYLVAVLVDDLFMTLLAPTTQPVTSQDKQAAHDDQDASATPKTREQAAVLLSGVSRTVVGLVALILLMAPYGEGPLELFHRAGAINDGLSIGEVNVKPAALIQAVLLLVVGLFSVRLFKEWVGTRYMPTTRMDVGMRLSVTTLIGYVGAVVVVALAMSAVGVGLERVAWVASALSVGIGFGLQAVVQNFVSGLILLAERPVKVGDWVSLSGVEGDIRRINVRATEIQMGDRSTVIVPNSEFITKIVRNVTYTDPLGMVQIKLPMPLSTDTRKARQVLLDAFQSHPGVLDTPAPNVQLDGIDGGNLVFNATGFVSSPRAAYGVRSDLLFDVLERLREVELPLGKPPTMLLSQAAAGPGNAPDQPLPI